MKEVLEYILKGIVKDPSSVEVVETVDENGTKVYEIHASEEDIGQIIGKDGRTIKSINILVNALRELPGKTSR
ncbi:hypothetical protein DU53_08075 [Kosmotoga sp. DU53]|nr:KH domain-containing protein [Kosmotoga sp. DU53]OAA20343.1 hypothetical protein DU53_08075 [Kosmotoga sp. DU53]